MIRAQDHLERAPNITTRFYEILFERYPETRALFSRNASRKQEEMLAQALVAVVDHLEDGAWLQQTLSALGAKHVTYGVTPQMYDWVGECLLVALAEAAGSDWNPVLHKAWLDAYKAIAGIMLANA